MKKLKPDYGWALYHQGVRISKVVEEKKDLPTTFLTLLTGLKHSDVESVRVLVHPPQEKS